MGNVSRSSTPYPRSKGIISILSPLPLLSKAPFMCCITLSRTVFHAVTTEYNDFTASVAISDLLNCTQNVSAAIKSKVGRLRSASWCPVWLCLLAWVCGDSTLSAIAVEVSWWQLAEAACRAVSWSFEVGVGGLLIWKCWCWGWSQKTFRDNILCNSNHVRL